MSPVALISPNLLVQQSDRFTTGIVYMPIGLASMAASLRADGHELCVVDAFAERPRQSREQEGFMVLGLSPEEVALRVPEDARVAFVYANQVLNHMSVVGILGALRELRPQVPRVVVENTQAVTAYALAGVADQLFAAGADYLLTGEPELRGRRMVEALQGDREAAHVALKEVDGVRAPDFATAPVGHNRELEALPHPAWDLFPVEAYWKLRFAHGPLSSARYLPILTSRGCPYPCRFCVVPSTNERSWRGRSAESVVDEMEHFVTTLGVREFHIEDLNPTVNDKRTRAICREIIDRGLDITWKLVAGTKVETIKSTETIDLMAAAGCRYISISPESGSARVLELIDKPFDLDHAEHLIERMNQVGIRSQTCFVLGFPGETDADRALTRAMVRRLVFKGADEIALFVVAPVPGSDIHDELAGYESLSQLSFSPSWRDDYAVLSDFRMRLYRSFLIWKTLRYPWKIAWQSLNFLRRRFETKMEMAPYRALYWTSLA